MGFTTGFTGGVTLTLSIAYLSILAHQRNRQAQGNLLRSQAQILHALSRQFEPPSAASTTQPERTRRLPEAVPTRAELAARRRAGFAETVKDRWNEEVEGAVRWVQGTDWDGVREDAEGVLGRAWGRVVRRTGVNGAVEGARTSVREAGEEAVRTAEDAASQAQIRVKDLGSGVVGQASRVAVEARDVLGQKAQTAGGLLAQTAAEAKEVAKDAITKGVEKGRDLAGQTKAAARTAEQRLEGKVDDVLPHADSDVEKALHQRYQRRDTALDNSVEEVLRERYRPMDRRDNTVLRGI